MAEEHKKEGFLDKVFHHHKQDDSQSGQAEGSEAKDGISKEEQKLKGDAKKDHHKFQDYMKEERQLDEEGKEYGGLM